MRSGLLAKIKWYVYMSKFHWSFCVSFSRTDAGLCIYHFFVWSNLNFLHISSGITLPTQLCLVLYSFCANLQHSLYQNQGLFIIFVFTDVIYWDLVSTIIIIRPPWATKTVITMVGGWWEQSIARAFTRCMIKKKLSLESFSSLAKDDGLLLEFKWQQLSLSLQESSQYSGRYHQYCNLHDLYLSSHF